MPHHILIVDDSPEKLNDMRMVADRRDPSIIIHTAEDIRGGLRLIELLGARIDEADFDFDLPDGTGEDLTRAMRQTNTQTLIKLFTARTDASFEEASGKVLAAGANAAFSSESMEGRSNFANAV